MKEDKEIISGAGEERQTPENGGSGPDGGLAALMQLLFFSLFSQKINILLKSKCAYIPLWLTIFSLFFTKIDLQGGKCPKKFLLKGKYAFISLWLTNLKG